MCLILLASLFPTAALALTKGTVYVSAINAGVYTSKKTSSKKIITVSFGQKIKCTAVSGKWATVKNSAGKTGYMLTSELSNSDTNTYKKTVYIQKNNLKVYQTASTSSKVLGKVKLGSGFVAVAQSSNGRWLRIRNGNKYGYVQAQYTDTSPYTKGTKVYMVKSSISVTSAPGAFDSIGSLSLGQSCWLVSKTSKYAKVRSSSGIIGYVNDVSVLSTKDPNTLNKKMYIQADKTPCYPHAITLSKTGSLNKNAAVTAVARHMSGNMEWYRVKYNKKYYYIPGILLADSKVPSGGRTIYANVTKFSPDQEGWAPLYEKPNLSSKQVGKITDGEKLTLVSCKGSGIRVRTSGGTLGYLLPTALRKNPT